MAHTATRGPGGETQETELQSAKRSGTEKSCGIVHRKKERAKEDEVQVGSVTHVMPKPQVHLQMLVQLLESDTSE